MPRRDAAGASAAAEQLGPQLWRAARRYLRRRLRMSVDAIEHLVGGLGTSILALAAVLLLVLVALAGVVGIGLAMVPSVNGATDDGRAATLVVTSLNGSVTDGSVAADRAALVNAALCAK